LADLKDREKLDEAVIRAPPRHIDRGLETLRRLGRSFCRLSYASATGRRAVK